MTGLFLAITMLRPLIHIDLGGIWADARLYSKDAERLTLAAQELAREDRTAIIKSKSEAYILDKAASLGAEVTVTVTLSCEEPLVPCAVRISGIISPYAKTQLSQIIQNDLAIPKEAQEWTG